MICIKKNFILYFLILRYLFSFYVIQFSFLFVEENI